MNIQKNSKLSCNQRPPPPPPRNSREFVLFVPLCKARWRPFLDNDCLQQVTQGKDREKMKMIRSIALIPVLFPVLIPVLSLSALPLSSRLCHEAEAPMSKCKNRICHVESIVHLKAEQRKTLTDLGRTVYLYICIFVYLYILIPTISRCFKRDSKEKR